MKPILHHDVAEEDLEDPGQHGHFVRYRHPHQWVLCGASRVLHHDGLGYSAWYPLYRCRTCKDVIQGHQPWHGVILRRQEDGTYLPAPGVD